MAIVMIQPVPVFVQGQADEMTALKSMQYFPWQY